MAIRLAESCRQGLSDARWSTVAIGNSAVFDDAGTLKQQARCQAAADYQAACTERDVDGSGAVQTCVMSAVGVPSDAVFSDRVLRTFPAAADHTQHSTPYLLI